MHVRDDYVIDGRQVLLRGRPIRGADPKTFVHVYGNWSRDSRYVYHLIFRLTKIDVDSFEPLNNIWCHDRGAVYPASGKPLLNADPKTFNVFDSGERSYLQNRFPGTNSCGFGGDAQSVWYFQFSYPSAWIVRGGDPETFRSLDAKYACDSQAVYYENKTIKGSRPKSFWLFSGTGFAVDESSVYHWGRPIPQADPQTFIPSQYSELHGRDKDRYFFMTRICSRDEYVESLVLQRASLENHIEEVRSGDFDRSFAECGAVRIGPAPEPISET